MFALEPGFAVVYAPLMVALGVLSRIEPGNIGPFVLRTSILLLLVLYSIYSDPLWSVIGWHQLVGSFHRRRIQPAAP